MRGRAPSAGVAFPQQMPAGLRHDAGAHGDEQIRWRDLQLLEIPMKELNLRFALVRLKSGSSNFGPSRFHGGLGKREPKYALNKAQHGLIWPPSPSPPQPP